MPELRFVWAGELVDATPAEPDWLLDGYVAPGSITLLAGKPKSGKSTLAWAIAEAVAGGAATFLGRPVRGGPVVYVTEEPPARSRTSCPPRPSACSPVTPPGRSPRGPTWSPPLSPKPNGSKP